MSELNEDKNRLISLPEAAQIYGFNPRFLGELARKGRLKAQKIGHRWVTTAEDVEDYIQSRQRTGLFRSDIEVPESLLFETILRSWCTWLRKKRIRLEQNG